jgi:hypothetical protein
MQAFEMPQLISKQAASNRLYLEFLKVPDLSMGLYALPVGGMDPQSPHTEDEVYYTANGRFFNFSTCWRRRMENGCACPPHTCPAPGGAG